MWTGDITYIATQEGWLYLPVVIDLFSQQVVGWAMGRRMTRHLVIDALTIAWFRRRPAEGLIHHSDQGSQPIKDVNTPAVSFKQPCAVTPCADR